MKQKEFYSHLKETGLPVAYGMFLDVPPLPYIVYSFTSSDDAMGDNQNYESISNYQVELSTSKKDLISEEAIESKLKEIRTPYMKSEVQTGSGKMYKVTYEVQIEGEKNGKE